MTDEKERRQVGQTCLLGLCRTDYVTLPQSSEFPLSFSNQVLDGPRGPFTSSQFRGSSWLSQHVRTRLGNASDGGLLYTNITSKPALPPYSQGIVNTESCMRHGRIISLWAAATFLRVQTSFYGDTSASRERSHLEAQSCFERTDDCIHRSYLNHKHSQDLFLLRKSTHGKSGVKHFPKKLRYQEKSHEYSQSDH